MLAAVLNSPNYLSPDRGADGRQALIERYDYVLDGMVSMGNLDSAEADKYYGTAAQARQAQDQQHVRRPARLHAHHGQGRAASGSASTTTEIDSGGLRVETTFTRKAMQAAEEGVLEERPQGLKKLHVATASVDVQTGALIGFYAGQDYLEEPAQLGPARRLARLGVQAVRARRRPQGRVQPQGHLRRQLPLRVPDGGGEVVNEGEGQGSSYGSRDQPDQGDRGLGQHRLRRPDRLDAGRAAEGDPRWPSRSASRGTRRGSKPNPAIALGSATISPINMANAYATIANGGKHHDWFIVKKVTRASDDKVLYRAPRKTNRVLSDDIARDVSYALQQVVKTGTGQNALGLGPSRGRQDRHRDQRRRRRLLVVVRRLHPAGRHRRDVRARQGQRGAQRLPADVLRRELPGLHLARDHGAAAGRRRGARSSRRRRTSTARHPPTGHAPYTPPPPKPKKTKKAKPQADADAPPTPPQPPAPAVDTDRAAATRAATATARTRPGPRPATVRPG